MEQSGALAPDAAVRVYQSPNTDAGFADDFYQAASENIADSVSASWGESESLIRAFLSVDARGPELPSRRSTRRSSSMAAQGQSSFLSSGDSGAYPASRDLGSTDRTAGSPDGSPWATSSGGTTLPGPFVVHGHTFNFPTERTWAWDYLWPVRSVDLGIPEIAVRRGGRRRQRRRLQRLRADAVVSAGRPRDVELQRGRVPASDGVLHRGPVRGRASRSASPCRGTGTSSQRRRRRGAPATAGRRPTCRRTATRRRAISCSTRSATRAVRPLRRRTSSSAARASSPRS